MGYLFINSGDTGPIMNNVAINTLYDEFTVVDCPLSQFG